MILADLVLPDMDGVDCLGRLRARGVFAPVVVLTGQATIESAVEAMRKGAVDYLTKPIDVGRLRGALEAVRRAPPVTGIGEVVELSSLVDSEGPLARRSWFTARAARARSWSPGRCTGARRGRPPRSWR